MTGEEDNVVDASEQFSDRYDLDKVIRDMTGPERCGCKVIVDGHVIPNMAMFDRGGTIEFMIDDRLVYEFTREAAPNAAHMAAVAMAIGAGHPHFAYPHSSAQPYGTPCVEIKGEIPK